MTPADFEHIDDLTHRIASGSTYSIGLVKHAETGRVFVEILHGELGDEQYAYAPVDVDPATVESWDGAWEGLARLLGTEAGL
ncbi:hypothetical protein [Nonomuraea lactucae]|uniref:hypothetical protein n=1 Tax=Nonomuraea lactucae TaxID=2249762 RepID=UPI000DE29404|nr:hypothetical protein [Nonomuraea lactucae]